MSFDSALELSTVASLRVAQAQAIGIILHYNPSRSRAEKLRPCLNAGVELKHKE